MSTLTAPADPQTPTFPAASLDRRFYAFALDRLVAWSLDLLAAVAIGRSVIGSGHLLLGVVLIVLVVLLVGAGFAVLQGLQGVSPGKAALGLRVVHHGTGTPIGVVPSLLRTLVLGASALPTFGLGTACLAWTAVMDTGRQRRGWHDHVTESIVVDVRPVPEEEDEVDEAPRHIVNLTAMRLVPSAQQPVAQQPAAQQPAAVQPAGPRSHRADPAAGVAVDRTQVRDHPRADPPAPAHPWRVAFDTGETFVVEGLALVGRRPEPRPGEDVRHVVPLPSEDMSLSKTHAQLQLAPDGALVVTDRGSTNGSVLVRQGVSRALPGGRPTTLLPGDLVRFGDRHLTVTRDG